MNKKQLRKPSNKITRTLANNLISFRKSKNISQETLAYLCGLHRTYVGSIEREERNVTLSTLETLAQVLDVSVSELLTNRDL